MTKLRRKYNRYRTLKSICYFLGYPLLLAMVFLGSLAMYKGAAFEDTWYYGLLIVAAAWVVVIVLQLIFSLFCRNKQGKALFSLIISLVIVIGGAIVLDVFGEKAIDKVNEENEQYGITVDDYKKQVQYYSPLTTGKEGLVEKYNDEFDLFCEIYNVKLKSELKGSVNADGSAITYLGGQQNEKVFKNIYKALKFDYEKDVYVSTNGMYADGYVFGAKQALDILITYNEIKEKYAAENKDADNELEKAVEKAYESSAWKSYTKTEEYKAAYGEDGTAYAHMLTMEKLDQILSIAGKDLGMLISTITSLPISLPSNITSLLGLVDEDLSVSKLVNTINNFTVEQLLDLAELAISIDDEFKDVLFEALLPIVEYASLSNSPLDFTDADTFESTLKELSVKNLLKSLDFDKLSGTLQPLGLDISEYKGIFANGLTVDFVEDLLTSLSLTNALFNYQSPTTKPVFEFIEDETLKEYAYANYYARIHGSNIGSVLVGENLGHVVMGDSGYPESKGFTLQQLYQLRTDISYATKLYPIMAARRYMYLLGGLIALMMALYYHNSLKQDEVFDKIAAGGDR